MARRAAARSLPTNASWPSMIIWGVKTSSFFDRAAYPRWRAVSFADENRSFQPRLSQ